ncbi:LamG domain-containing protein [Pseudoalteromonas denitrificans]|uniref:MSHA biogenesis protein MshQ n=1 Tax=Pseudoalteromonas denitrificans DSM 6059 TaxID=1123010 RepID=A0A1I1DRM9_9GAMM|nr:LamG domain-containing protein [Pseudoalteromonas denitrificans]SFB77457.1 MSHA biogenesis protein MshQ [Pseudoalteromonas denitrificans DSM 6059]
MLKLKHLINLFIVLFGFASFYVAALPQCNAVFPGAAATFNNAKVILNNKVKLNDNNNGWVYTKTVDIKYYDKWGKRPKCNNQYCYANGTEASQVPAITSNDTVTTLPNTLNGDYYINTSYQMIGDYTVSGPTRIFILSSSHTGYLSILSKVNNGGDPENLSIYIDGTLSLGSAAKVSAYIYTTKSITVGSSSQITGAITAGNDIDLGQDTQINYQTPPERLPGICGPVPVKLVSEYRFDALSWVNGSANQVIDSVSGFNGTAYGTQPVEGKVCNAVDLSASGIYDYLNLDKQVFDGKTDFSISFWLNSERTSGQSIFSGAKSSAYFELVMWFNSHTSFQPYLKNDENGSISISSIADNNWHHVVWTRSGSQNCLYRDKALQGCTSLSSEAIDIQRFILGQEQSNTGFDSRYAFEGLVDELLVYEGALSSSEIDTIYNNQNAGLGHDGSSRLCTIPSPVLDMRFDETDYIGTNAVKDSSGNNYHGTSTKVLPTAGLVCNAADFSENSASDYLQINAGAMNGLSDFTVMVWGKTSSNSNSTIISAAKNGSNPSLDANEATFFFENNNRFWPTITAAPFDTSTKLSSTSNMNDDNWHQLVWTRKANTAQSCFFLDGVSQGCITHNDDDGNDNAALQVAGLILGQDQDSFLGSFDDSQDWEGLLDELLIFNTVLDTQQINAIKTNIEAKKTWDGSARACLDLTPVAEYRFDETNWDGSAGDAKDSSANNLHLTSYNANTSNANPIVSGSPGYCRYGEFNGSSSYLQLDTSNSLISLADEVSVTAWINPDVLPTGTAIKTIVSKDENYEFHLNSSGNIFWWWGGGAKALTSTNANITAGNWYHIAITYKDGLQKIYVNGIERASATEPGKLTLNNDLFQVGQDQNSSGRFFDGGIDEVKIFKRYLSAAEVIKVKDETRTCAQTVDHYRLVLADNTGLTCEAETMTIKACEDASCNSIYTGSVNVNLSPDTGWLDNSDTPVTDGIYNLTTGELPIKYSQTTPVKVSYALDSANPSADLKCYTGSSEVTCETVFADAGFEFVDAHGNKILNQVAGINSSVLFLKSVIKDSSTGACKTAFKDKQKISFKLNCDAPSVCSDTPKMKLTLKGVQIPDDSYKEVELDFDNDDFLASLGNLNYTNAGKISLSVKATAPNGSNISDVSNEFVVIPQYFKITAEGSHDAKDGVLSAVYKKAGEAFDVTLEAKNEDGVTTDNFNHADINISNLLWKHDLQLPTLAQGGVAGNLTSPTVNTGFAKGVALYENASWDEVGIIKLKAELASNSYMGHGNTINGEQENLGRFVPADFNLFSSSVSWLPQCKGFIYMGQNFTTNYNLQARNTKSIITKNYNTINGLAKGVISIDIENDDSSSGGNYKKSSDFGSRLTVPINAWVDGSVILRDSNNSVLAKSTTPDGNFNQSNIILSVVDSDGVKLLDLNQNPDAQSCGSPINCTGKKLNGDPLDFRYGRLTMLNTHGSEFNDTQIPMRVEYWNGSEFIVNRADFCSNYGANITQLLPDPNPIPADPNVPKLTFKSIGNIFNTGSYVTGQGVFVDKVTQDQTGLFKVEYNATPDWLKSNWDPVTQTGDNPTSTIQFGRFRGEDRVIYWKEK